MEGIHDQRTNFHILHSGPDCVVSNDTNLFTGTLETDDCHAFSPKQYLNEGCRIEDSNALSYGQAFNDNGGGIFVTEIDTLAISTWFFPHGSEIPDDLLAGSPDPTTWSAPVARFQGGCDIPTKFYAQRMVFTTTFCGDVSLYQSVTALYSTLSYSWVAPSH